jgi:hypothetical protein
MKRTDGVFELESEVGECWGVGIRETGQASISGIETI